MSRRVPRGFLEVSIASNAHTPLVYFSNGEIGLQKGPDFNFFVPCCLAYLVVFVSSHASTFMSKLCVQYVILFVCGLFLMDGVIPALKYQTLA